MRRRWLFFFPILLHLFLHFRRSRLQERLLAEKLKLSRAMRCYTLVAYSLALATPSLSFQPPLASPLVRNMSSATQKATQHKLATKLSATKEISSDQLYTASARRAFYAGNYAQYLLDLSDSRATFDFCGGMFFEFTLSTALRARLAKVAQEGAGSEGQPVVFGADAARMHQTPEYSKSSAVDSVRYFHGREVRQVPDARGGRGFVLQLSDGDEGDVEGWSEEERATYDGWGHDSGRQWRKMDDWEGEGVKIREKFGDEAFGLNHRFYLHFDRDDNFWLSAEDGCEGKAAEAKRRGYFQGLFN